MSRMTVNVEEVGKTGTGKKTTELMTFPTVKLSSTCKTSSQKTLYISYIYFSLFVVCVFFPKEMEEKYFLVHFKIRQRKIREKIFLYIFFKEK